LGQCARRPWWGEGAGHHRLQFEEEDVSFPRVALHTVG
jgi:hypothetical protein